MDWTYLKWKLLVWPRLELIYLLGGTPNEHINTVHYRNMKSIVSKLKKKIDAPNI